MQRALVTAALLLCTLVPSFVSAQQSPSYTVEPVVVKGKNGGPDEPVHYVPKINNAGQIVAMFFLWSGEFSYIIEGGQLRDLGGIGGVGAWARDINDGGFVAGHAATADQVEYAIVAGQNFMSPLGSLGNNDEANGINNLGTVVGVATVNNHHVPTRWTSATPEALTLPAEAVDATADAVNDSGQVAGNAVLNTGESRGYLWSANTTSFIPTFGGPNSTAYSINQAGMVVGVADTANLDPYAYEPSYQHIAFLYWNGTFGPLGNLGGINSTAAAINNHAQVVGSTGDNQAGLHAFLWDPATGMKDLNLMIPANSGWVLEAAQDINDAGQIVGQGTYNGTFMSFVLTPVGMTPPVMPDYPTDYFPFLVGRRWELQNASSQALTMQVTEEVYPQVFWLTVQSAFGSVELSFGPNLGKIDIRGWRALGTGGSSPGHDLYFDTTAPVNTEWTNTFAHMIITDKGITVTTPAGTYTNCIRIVAHDWTGSTVAWTLAPNVGPVRVEDANGTYLLQQVVTP